MKPLVAAATGLLLLASARSQPADDSELPRWAPLDIPLYLLVANPAVQEELRFSVKQRTEIVALVKDANDLYRGWSKLDWTIRDQKTITERIMTGNRLAKILNEDQVKRLEQIDRQRQGPAVIMHDDRVSASLKLSPDQRQKLQILAERTRLASQRVSHELLSLDPKYSVERGKTIEKIIKLYGDAGAQVEAELSEQQKKVWRSLRGKPFDLRLLLQSKPALFD